MGGREQREERREADTRKGTSSRDCQPSIELEPKQKYTIRPLKAGEKAFYPLDPQHRGIRACSNNVISEA